MEISKYSAQAQDTFDLAALIGQNIPPGTVIAASGDLGVGKTVFAKGLAQGLQIADIITSPTYIYFNEYQGRLTFCHIDAYRLETFSEEEIEQLGLGDCFLPHKVVLVEWPQYCADYLPQDTIELHISREDGADDNRRSLRFRFMERQHPWLYALLTADIERI